MSVDSSNFRQDRQTHKAPNTAFLFPSLDQATHDAIAFPLQASDYSLHSSRPIVLIYY